MRIYKLKFNTEQEALDFVELHKIGLLEFICVDFVEIEFDMLHENENIKTEFEVFPKVIKHNFL